MDRIKMPQKFLRTGKSSQRKIYDALIFSAPAIKLISTLFHAVWEFLLVFCFSAFMRDIIKKMKRDQEQLSKMEKDRKKADQDKISLQKTQEKLQSSLNQALVEKDSIMAAMKKRFTPAQIDRLLFNKKSNWSSTDYGAAIILLGLSSKGYIYVRTQYELPLPCVSAVKEYLSNITFSPGALDSIFSLMEYVGGTMDEKMKKVGFSFDEMHLYQKTCHDQKLDQVIGPCKQVQVVNVRSVFGNWKNPIYYNFDTPMTKELYTTLVQKLHSAGFEVVANVCDSAAPNKKFFKTMGATVSKPEFPNPVTGYPVVCLHDPPHNLKLCRNYILDAGVRLNPRELPALVASKDILYELVTMPLNTNISLSLPSHDLKIDHLEVKGSDRQNVRKAKQFLSKETGRAIIVGAEKNLFKSINAEVGH
jgi:Transposase protein